MSEAFYLAELSLNIRHSSPIEFKFAVRLTILGNLIIVVILIFIFIFFKVEQSKYLDIADIYWV